MKPEKSKGHLPRLTREAYRGWAVVHWTQTVRNRETGWLNATFHQAFREILLHAMTRYQFTCPVYCLMPDHVHLLWMGLGPESDQRLAIAFLRKHMLSHLAPAT